MTERAVVASTVRITEGPASYDEVLEDLALSDCGALVVAAALARGRDVEVTLTPQARHQLEHVVRETLLGDVKAARIVHAKGRVPAGRPLALVAAAAVHREQAFEAAQRLLNGLKGVAQRRDL